MGQASHPANIDDRVNSRRAMLTLVAGAAAALSATASAQPVQGGVLVVRVTDILTNLTVEISVKRNCAVSVCAAIEVVSSAFNKGLVCQIVE